ncbi:pseudouridine synthase pus4 [Recurvomyces mirabilis]|nr:pseudouridine synthase pus4 [Recurvomyces mirabilis]
MPPTTNTIHEGVFAINKPPAITSAQVIRDVQRHFNPSSLFAPWMKLEQDKKDAESHNQRNKRKSWKQRQPPQLKMGHGGTLDPLATGVLILGVGSGTKALNSFLGCTKSYEAVVLFGAATDTYDCEGKVVARKGYEHITRDAVEEAMKKFRGEIMQRPPIFSALRVQGKRLYEYAREGKEVPVEIQERPLKVAELHLMEWYDGGSHKWKWPEQEAGQEEKEVVEKVLHLGGDVAAEKDKAQSSSGAKRKREVEETIGGSVVDAEAGQEAKRTKSSPEPEPALTSGALPSNEKADANHPPSTTDAITETITALPSTEPCPAPAIRLRMTVSSGFYVRSLAHDLGAAVGSLGIMTSLVRTRQGEFELGKNVLQYEELAEGEEVWGPKVRVMLKEWQEGRNTSAGLAANEGEGQYEGNGKEGVGKQADGGDVGDENAGEDEDGRAKRTNAKPERRAKIRRNSSSDGGA